MGNDPPEELNDENSKKKVSSFIKDSLKGLKKLPRVISPLRSLYLFFFFFILWKDCFSDTAFITNQESNKLDVIDLKNKKISEFSVGEKPAGIFVDKKNNEIFVSNPGSHNISRINLKNNSQQLLVSGKSR